MAEDVGGEDLAKGWLLRLAIFEGGLRGGDCACAGKLVGGIGHCLDWICQVAPDCQRPINACETAKSCIANDGVDVRQVAS